MKQTDIYDDFKLTKTLCSPWFIQQYFSVGRVKINRNFSNEKARKYINIDCIFTVSFFY